MRSISSDFGSLSKLALLVFLVAVLSIPMYLSNTAPKYAIVSAQSTTSKEIVVINLDVPIDEGSSSMVFRTFARAQADHAAAVIIDMNTPGGLLEDMLSIVNSISNSTASGIPVYTYVGNDSLAASAGSYIAMATKKIFQLLKVGPPLSRTTPRTEC